MEVDSSYIHCKLKVIVKIYLLAFRYGVAAGKDAAWVEAQRSKINGLWGPLKQWMINNDLQSRLRDVAEYIPAPHCNQVLFFSF